SSTTRSTTAFYSLSLHDALPIFCMMHHQSNAKRNAARAVRAWVLTRLRERVLCACFLLDGPDGTRRLALQQFDSSTGTGMLNDRSEEHTSELQSRSDLVCRLLLE